MKSYETLAFTIYDGIFEDATTRWPNLEAQFRKDLSYLRRAVEKRGLPFITITLPALGKSLMQWLDKGYMADSEIPQGVPLKQKRPKLFGEFFDMIFDNQGCLVEDVDIEAVKFLLQLCVVCKNVRLDCHPSRTKETLNEFYAIEESLPSSHPDTWDSDIPVWQDRSGHPIWGTGTSIAEDDVVVYRNWSQDSALISAFMDDDVWDDLRAHARRIIGTHIGHYPVWDIEPKHGPGVVSEGLKGTKYQFPNWPTKLENLFPYDWYGSGSFADLYRPDHRESPSRLIAVPKSQKGPRLICAEPTSHQWIQQGLWVWMASRIDRSPLRASIQFDSQVLSRNRALNASQDARLCTIDLSSASDRISTRLVEYIFQGTNLLDAMHACRTRRMVQTLSDEHPSEVVLKKFSTMGSALTFPVQTLLFYILVTWALRLHDRYCMGDESLAQYGFSVEDVTIFGDDIIAPTMAYKTIKFVLHECGLRVNNSKTFTGNHFRESCGMYAFKGHDVSPAYYLEPYDGSPGTLATTIEMSNNFHLRGYWATARNIVSQFPQQELKKLLVTDVDGAGGLGLKSFCGYGFHLHQSKWCPDYQREYITVLTTSVKTQMTKGPGECSLSQYFFEKPNPEFPWESGRASSVKQRKRLARVYG